MPTTRIKFIEPMYARLVNKLPEGDDWLYEVKFDGYRCLAGKNASGITLWSRRENLFTVQFPSITMPVSDCRTTRWWTAKSWR
jgi:bifunctional non-homologous end joining protein LigD